MSTLSSEHGSSKRRVPESEHRPSKHKMTKRDYVVLVCGSRKWADEQQINNFLQTFIKTHAVTKIVHGGADGADKIGATFALSRGIECDVYLPDWSVGKRAGVVRNSEMLVQSDPHCVIAFRTKGNSRGTDDMVTKSFTRAKSKDANLQEIHMIFER